MSTLSLVACADETAPASQEGNATAKDKKQTPSPVSALDVDDAALAWAASQAPDLSGIPLKRWLMARVVERLTAIDQAQGGSCVGTLALAVSFSDNPDAVAETQQLRDAIDAASFPVVIGESSNPDPIMYADTWASPPEVTKDGTRVAPWYGHTAAIQADDGASYIPLDRAVPPLYQTTLAATLLDQGATYDVAISEGMKGAHPTEVEVTENGETRVVFAARYLRKRDHDEFSGMAASELIGNDQARLDDLCNEVIVGGFGAPADGKIPPHRAHAPLVDLYLGILQSRVASSAGE